MIPKIGAQLFYGIALDGEAPWGEEDPYHWWAGLNIGSKPADKEALDKWHDDCLNFNSRTLIECNRCGDKDNPSNIVYIKASLIMSTGFDFKKVNLPSVVERYSPGWDQALRDFCIRTGVLWDPDRAGWKLAADMS